MVWTVHKGDAVLREINFRKYTWCKSHACINGS